MANQRKKTKFLVGGYVDVALKDDIEQIAKDGKKTKTDVVVKFLTAGVEDYKADHPEFSVQSGKPHPRFKKPARSDISP